MLQMTHGNIRPLEEALHHFTLPVHFHILQTRKIWVGYDESYSTPDMQIIGPQNVIQYII